jgi:hypothetical protein
MGLKKPKESEKAKVRYCNLYKDFTTAIVMRISLFFIYDLLRDCK